MAQTWVSGFDGTITLPTGHAAHLRVWDGRFSRAVSDITGFSDSGRRRKLGIFDLEGSAGGTTTYDASNLSPGINTSDWNRDGGTLVLGVVGSTACAYTATAVMTNISFSVAKDGDSSITFDFANSGGTVPTEAWDETP